MKIILTKGLPASGKTTWAEKFVVDNQEYVNINRDDLRKMSFGAANMYKGDEKYITVLQENAVREALKSGKSVVISDTNLNPKTLNRWKTLAEEIGADFEINDSFMEVSLDECIRRDNNRQNPVGSKVIRDMHKKYIQNSQSRDLLTFVEIDHTLPKCVVFDVDGTLTTGPHQRSPYDWKLVRQDLVNPYVLNFLHLFTKLDDYSIIVLSGRDEVCREETLDWLYNHLPELAYTTDEYFQLHMRPKGDFRKDNLVKLELYERHIKGKYNVMGIFDDRKQVVEMWHSLNLPVFRVGDPNADF